MSAIKEALTAMKEVLLLTERVEQAMTRSQYIASFIGLEPGRALFVGLYSIKGSEPITFKQFMELPANVELINLGMNGPTKETFRSSTLWFDLVLTDSYLSWKGKLVVGWPGPERAWWRWSKKPKNEMPVLVIAHSNRNINGYTNPYNSKRTIYKRFSRSCSSITEFNCTRIENRRYQTNN